MRQRATVFERGRADQLLVFRIGDRIAERVTAERHGERTDDRIAVQAVEEVHAERFLQAEQVVGLDAGAIARDAGRRAAVVVDAQRVVHAIARLVADVDDRFAGIPARQDLHRRLVAAQTVDLRDALIDIRKAQRLARRRRKRVVVAGVREPAAACRRFARLQPVNRLAVDREGLDGADLDRDPEGAGGKVLRPEQRTRRHEAVRDEDVRDALQQHVDAMRAELAARERLDSRSELLGRDPARRLEGLTVGRLEQDPLDGEGRSRFHDRIDRCIHRDVERRLGRRRDRHGRRRLFELALARLLALLLDDQLRRILHRTGGGRRRLRVRRYMTCREDARDQQWQLQPRECAWFHRYCACGCPGVRAAVP
ncbi:hypothetical protein BVI434_1730009 [Burkholderia vietnamiensis]|nr:hypothetical protein BVI434_1730009 [Burkholderia vietnamiensis]